MTSDDGQHPTASGQRSAYRPAPYGHRPAPPANDYNRAVRMSASRFVCIHGHFYQPPRENPWLDAVELQDSAAPYHDWNERITAECYAPNASARILDQHDRIVKIVNNYDRISFNFGPTLLSWLERSAPDTFRSIVDADRRSIDRFGGHGSALAQPHSHLIMPLATRRDKVTQVAWGIGDFERCFGRFPEGMWLPETAVDIETLEVLAESGIRFTILEPHQVRLPSSDGGGARSLNLRRPYDVALPSGRRLSVFLYDGAISRAVAFEQLLTKGEFFAERLLSAFASSDEPQLVHIATDGETYGHHHRHGDMALAWALESIEASGAARITNYGEFLELFPPTENVEIVENTSWSCAHGVERWRADCGCRTGGETHWTQAWRAPLRAALDSLRDELSPRFEERAGQFFTDPWAARDRYVDVVLDRDPKVLSRFFRSAAVRPLSQEEQVSALQLLEMQRNAMLMFTSCGWFFNDAAGLETTQILQYAGRAIQLAEPALAVSLEPSFLARLEAAVSNVPEQQNARAVYERSVRPAVVTLERLGAHYAVASLFRSFPEEAEVFSFNVRRHAYDGIDIGRARVAIGHIEVCSNVTLESAELMFGVLYLGDVHVTGGISKFTSSEDYRTLREQLSEPHLVTDFPALLRILDEVFGGLTISIKSLFRDEQRHVLSTICDSTFAEAEAAFRQLHDRYVPLMRFHAELGIPLPKVLQVAAEFDLNLELRRAFERPDLALDQVDSLLRRAQTEGVALHSESVSYALENTLETTVQRLTSEPGDLQTLKRAVALATLARTLPLEVDLWRTQNIYYQMLRSMERALEHDTAWTQQFRALGEALAVKVA